MSESTTAIYAILDRSGSMNVVTSDIIGGYNRFLEEQKAEPGKANISLIQFDDSYEVVYTSRALSQAPKLTASTYTPRGTTALLDAIGRTVSDAKARYRKMGKARRPGKILFLIMTDGLENTSREYDKTAVMKLISEQEKEGWKFVFIGASLDALAEARDLGVRDGNMLRSSLGTSQGVQDAYVNVSASLKNYRNRSIGSAAKSDFFDSSQSSK